MGKSELLVRVCNGVATVGNSVAATQRNIQDVMPHEISRTPKDQYRRILLT